MYQRLALSHCATVSVITQCKRVFIAVTMHWHILSPFSNTKTENKNSKSRSSINPIKVLKCDFPYNNSQLS